MFLFESSCPHPKDTVALFNVVHFFAFSTFSYGSAVHQCRGSWWFKKCATFPDTSAARPRTYPGQGACACPCRLCFVSDGQYPHVALPPTSLHRHTHSRARIHTPTSNVPKYHPMYSARVDRTAAIAESTFLPYLT